MPSPYNVQRRVRLWMSAAFICLLALAALVGLGSFEGATFVPAANAQDPGPSADVLVDFGDGRVAFERVPIGAGASGVDLLNDSGLGIELGSGGLVCRVNGVGCPADDCFCECGDLDDCLYWNYFQGDRDSDGGWAFAEVGAESRKLEDGDIDAWVWGAERKPITATLELRDALAGGETEMGSADSLRTASVGDAAAWVMNQRTEDGGFEGFGLGSTIDAVLALDAAGLDPDSPLMSGMRPSDAIKAGAAEYATSSVSAAGKLLVAARVLDLDYRDIGGINIEEVLWDSYDQKSEAFGEGGTWDQAWPIIGLSMVSTGHPVEAEPVRTLINAAAEGGGWGFEANAETADADSTGLALLALGAARRSARGAAMVSSNTETSEMYSRMFRSRQHHAAVRSGLAALRTLQNSDGGFSGHDGTTNANSTAYAIYGLIASAQEVGGLGWSVAGVGTSPDIPRSPFDALRSFQGADGAFAGFSGPSDPSATYAALLGLAGRLPSGPFDSLTDYMPSQALSTPSWIIQEGPEGDVEDPAGQPTGSTSDAIEGSDAQSGGTEDEDGGTENEPGLVTGGDAPNPLTQYAPFILLIIALAAGLIWLRRRG